MIYKTDHKIYGLKKFTNDTLTHTGKRSMINTELAKKQIIFSLNGQFGGILGKYWQFICEDSGSIYLRRNR